MKRTILLLLISSFILPPGFVFAQTVPVTPLPPSVTPLDPIDPITSGKLLTDEEIKAVTGTDLKSNEKLQFKFDPVVPRLLRKTTVTVEDVEGEELKDANIFWYVDDKPAGNDTGLTSLEINLMNFDSVIVKVIVSKPSGEVITYNKTITAQVTTENKAEEDVYMIENKKKDSKIEIRSTPSSPRIYQQVKFYVYSKDKNLKLYKKQIIWYVNGKQKSAGLMGDSSFWTKLTNQAATTTISVDIMDYGEDIDAEAYTIPRSDPKLKFNTSQAQRALFCLAEYAELLDRDAKALEKELEDLEFELTTLLDKIDDDIDNQITSIETLGDDIKDTLVVFGAQTTALAKNGMSLNLLAVAKSFRTIGKFINDNSIAARLKDIENMYEFYGGLKEWFIERKEGIENKIKSMRDGATLKYKRCLEIATKKPDFRPKVKKF